MAVARRAAASAPRYATATEPAAAFARLALLTILQGQLGDALALVGLQLEAIELVVMVGVEGPEEAQGVGGELGLVEHSVVVGVGAGEPGRQAVLAAERLARGADEQARRTGALDRWRIAAQVDDGGVGLRLNGCCPALDKAQRQHRRHDPSRHSEQPSPLSRPAFAPH